MFPPAILIRIFSVAPLNWNCNFASGGTQTSENIHLWRWKLFFLKYLKKQDGLNLMIESLPIFHLFCDHITFNNNTHSNTPAIETNPDEHQCSWFLGNLCHPSLPVSTFHPFSSRESLFLPINKTFLEMGCFCCAQTITCWVLFDSAWPHCFFFSHIRSSKRRSRRFASFSVTSHYVFGASLTPFPPTGPPIPSRTTSPPCAGVPRRTVRSSIQRSWSRRLFLSLSQPCHKMYASSRRHRPELYSTSSTIFYWCCHIRVKLRHFPT